MPKKPPALCMFCGNAPCTCPSSATQRQAVSRRPAVKVKRERPAPSAAQTETRPSVSDGVGSVFDNETIEVTRFKVKDEVDRDLDMESALRIILLAKILAPASAREIEAVLSPPLRQDVDRRLSDWKARNGMVD